MASGEALMMKLMVPNASMPAMTDAMKRGWLAITGNGRGGSAAAASCDCSTSAFVEGNSMNDITVKTMRCRMRIDA